MRKPAFGPALAPLLAAALLCGCAGPGGGVGRLARAAAAAAAEPHSWVPAVGAAAVALGGWDRPMSNWAREHKPVFGSRAGAEGGGDALVALAGAGALAAALAAPGDPGADGWPSPAARALAVEGAAVATQGLAVWGLKAAVDRRRPNGSSGGSFPSAHASTAAAFAALGRHNLEGAEVRNPLRVALGVGFTVLEAGAGWARVEAGRHYPTDVLAGAALGNFVASVWYRACLGGEPRGNPPVTVAPAAGGIAVQFRGEF